MAASKFGNLNDHDLLIYVATKIEELVGNGKGGLCAQHEERMAEYSARLRRLELWRSRMAGILAVLSLLYGAAVALWAATVRHP